MLGFGALHRTFQHLIATEFNGKLMHNPFN